jgi:hypothetical protein
LNNAAIGFSAHTGWAAAITIGDGPRVLDRRRVDLLARGVPFECYHAASALSRPRAEALIERARRTAQELAEQAIDEIADAARHDGCNVVASGVTLSSARPLLTLDECLASHPSMHSAEGHLYRQALLDAARSRKLRVVALPERDLYDGAAVRLGLTPHGLRDAVGALGREMGAPWGKDQKNAALIAWLSLASATASRKRRA